MKITTYMKKYKFRYLLGFVGMIMFISLDLVSPMIIQRIIDDVVVARQMQLLMPLLFGLIAIGAGKSVFGYLEEFTFDCIGMNSTNDMRKDVFDHVQTLSADFFQKHNTGELMTRIKDDVDKVCVAIGFIGMLAIDAAVHTILSVVCMLRISPVLTLVPLILMPMIGFLAVRMERRLGKVYDEISDETAALNTVAEENLAGVRTVKAFAREEHEMKKFCNHNRRFYELNMRQAGMVAAYQPLISTLGKVLLLAVVVLGGLLVIRGDMTLGDLGAFSEYANIIIWPMEVVGWLSNDIASAVASWKKIKKIMKEEPAIKDPTEVLETGMQIADSQAAAGQAAAGQAAAGQAAAGQVAVGQAAAGQAAVGQAVAGQAAVGQAAASQTADSQSATEQTVESVCGGQAIPEKIEGRLTFDHVSLELEGQKILDDISFDLQPGKTLGIMGMTGAGKSMMVNLAERFYDPTEGRVLLDGVDLRKLPLMQLRSSMAVVSQDVFLFSDTVNQNVRMGQKKGMMAETVRWALERADAFGFVSQLSDQEETLIGERGVGLSGGQKQRISIARAVAKKAPILILDDSTSALDMETERQIQRDLANVGKITKMIIGHRVSAVRSADEILILQDGKIIERGTHKELMEMQGQYYQTWCVQYGEEVSACQ